MKANNGRYLCSVLVGFVAVGCEGDSVRPAAARPVSATGSASEESDAAANPFAGRIVDLTHPFDETTIYWPTDTQGFKLEKGPAGFTKLGYYYSANRFSCAEHGGTHLDAPIHFFENRETADQIPLDRLLGPAVVVDVTESCKSDPDYQIGVADLRDWEERHGRPLADVILLLRTGYADHWPDREEYLGTAAIGEDALPQMHFPGLDPGAAKWLAEHRAVKAVGIDTASIDHGQSKRFQSHVRLFEHNVPVFENVANLDGLPETGFSVAALPIKIGGGSGGPLRIVAIVPD